MPRSHRSWIEIDLTAFKTNFTKLKELLPANMRIMQIVKADAYGHGAVEIGRKALEAGASWLGVANTDEGALLRLQNFSCPILILSPSMIDEIPEIVSHQLIPSISSLEFARALSDFVEEEYPVHINIDTGMGRSGISRREATKKIAEIIRLPKLNIEGIYTHFASAESDLSYTRKQVFQFKRVLKEMPLEPLYIHYGNSSSIISLFPLPGNMVRIGALSYGFYTDIRQKSQIKLEPVLTYKSRIVQLKEALRGDNIGYNTTYKCPYPTRYAIVPVGYADGYDYLLSNKGKVEIGGEIAAVIGKVSMDMIAVDVTRIDSVCTGDEVTLLGSEEIRVEDAAAHYSGSAYELLCQTGRRAKRFYREDGKIVSSAPLLRREFVSSDYDDSKLCKIIESSISQRLESTEIAKFITDDLIRDFFRDKDRNITYRHNFKHTVTFSNESLSNYADYYIVRTELSYKKELSNSSFIIACANSEEHLSEYFLDPIVEYRWLLDNNLPLNNEVFRVNQVEVNGIKLDTLNTEKNRCLEIHCSNDALVQYIGKEVEFNISTMTLYPRRTHQLSIYLTDVTKGYEIEFNYPPEIHIENVIPIFSGRDKFPLISSIASKVRASSEEWVFPLSGIVFVYAITS